MTVKLLKQNGEASGSLFIFYKGKRNVTLGCKRLKRPLRKINSELFCCSPTWRTCRGTSLYRGSEWVSQNVPTTRLTTLRLCGWREATLEAYQHCTREQMRSSRRLTRLSLEPTCITWLRGDGSSRSRGHWSTTRSGLTVSICYFTELFKNRFLNMSIFCIILLWMTCYGVSESMGHPRPVRHAGPLGGVTSFPLRFIHAKICLSFIFWYTSFSLSSIRSSTFNVAKRLSATLVLHVPSYYAYDNFE